MNKPAIIVVGYNRAKSIERILNSIAKAKFSDTDINLIISIDNKCDNQDVLEAANKFEWKYGTKQVAYQPQNLGLRKHILQCGDLTEKYGSVIILEDDLFVSPMFYEYSKQALDFSEDKNYIGGVSLYNHRFSIQSKTPFYKVEDGYDNWYFQFASSWGQCWTKKQWQNFRKWYDENSGIEIASENMPMCVSSWPKSSWLKYFIKFLVETDRYFIYPRTALTTNFSDAGTHASGSDTTFQVPLLFAENKQYNFSELEQSKAVYNVFFENTKLLQYFDSTDITIDLNGSQTVYNNRYILSVKPMNYKIIKSFGCELRPIEANIFYDIPGNDIFIYDTKAPSSNNFGNGFENRKLEYKFRGLYLFEERKIAKKCINDSIKKIKNKLFK